MKVADAIITCVAVLAVLAAGSVCRAQSESPSAPASNGQSADGSVAFEEAAGVELRDRLGEAVPFDVTLWDAQGREQVLGRYLGKKKPVVLVMAYYRCPMICPMVIEQLVADLNGIDYLPGHDYQVLVVSFDHTEETAAARAAKERALGALKFDPTPEVAGGLEFFTTTAREARRLADAVGYEFKFLPRIKEYAHPTVLIILSEQGVVTRYLSGLDNSDAETGVSRARDLKLALLEASQGKIATGIGDWFMHLCFRFDREEGVYVLAAMRVMQIAGLFTVVVLATLVAVLRLGEIRRRRRSKEHAPGPLPAAAGLQP